MNSLRTAKRFVFPLLGLWVLLYASFSLFTPPLLDGTDSIQAEAAREMAVGGSWVTPHVNGEPNLNVSPLLTWSVAAGFRLLGVSDWTARFVVALYALGLFMVVMALGTRLFLTPVAGFYAVLILLTSVGIFLFAHLLYPQVLSALWLALAIYFFWRSLRHEHASSWTAAGFGLACALGVLSQGWLAVVIPVAIVLLFLAITGNLRYLFRWHPLIAIAVFLLVAVPWYVLVYRATGFSVFSISAPGSFGVSWLLVWILLLALILPWCLFSVAALIRASGRILPRFSEADCVNRDCAREARLLLVLWLIVTAFAALFPYMRMYSALPVLPALALLAAGWLTADEPAPSPLGRIFAWIFLGAGILMAMAALILAAHAPFPAAGADIATFLHLHPGQHRSLFGHITDLTASSMGFFRIPLSITAAALLVGTTANLFFRLKNKARMANCFLAGMMVCLLIAAQIALNTFSPVISSAVLAEAIKPEVNPDDIIVINGRYRDASAMSFYLEQPIRLLTQTSSSEAGPYETPGSLAEQWGGSGRVFLWTTPESAPVLPGSVYLIARDGGREILSNEPNSGGASF